MFPYLLVFVVGSLYFFLGKNLAQNKKLLLFFFLYVSLFIGLGDMIGGYDRYIYGEIFDSIADWVRGRNRFIDFTYLIQGNEYGYFVWQLLVSMITPNRYMFILFTTFLIYALLYRTFSNYIVDYPFATIIFLGLFYYFTMTYLRQVIAAAIIWQGLRYVWERRPFMFSLFVLLAFSFHNSALIFAPVYFVPLRKFSKTVVLLTLISCLIIAMTPLPNMLLSLSGETANMSERTAAYVNDSQGFRIEYLLEVIFFMWIYLSNYNRIDGTKNIVFLNVSILFCCILLIFMRFTQGGRLAWYFFVGPIYLLPYLSSKKDAKWVKYITYCVCFFLFLRVSYAWEMLNVPYKTIFTYGEPAGSRLIYEHYEYNTQYASDKFIRPAFDIFWL